MKRRRFGVIYFLTLLLAITTSAFSADINITTRLENYDASFFEDNQTLNIGSGGNLLNPTSFASGAYIRTIATNRYANWTINVNANASDGIYSTKEAIKLFSALDAGSPRGQELFRNGTINLNSGVIKSTNSIAIYLAKATLYPVMTDMVHINAAAGTEISGIDTAIYFVGGKLYLENAGKIQASGTSSSSSSSSSGVLLLSGGESYITNTGSIISTSSSGSSYDAAIGVGSVFSSPRPDVTSRAIIDNKGLIKGAIIVSAFTSSANITNSGSIIGSIKSQNSGKINIFNSGSIAGNITLGSVADSSLSSTAGSIVGNLKIENSAQDVSLTGGSFAGNVSLVSGSQIKLGAVDFAGDVSGVGAGLGKVSIVDNFTLNSAATFGKLQRLDSVNISSNKTATFNGLVNSSNLIIESGATLNLNSDVTALNTSVLGTLNFGDTSKTFTGNITGSGTSNINLASASHKIAGDLTLNSGDILTLKFANSQLGKLIVSGALKINAGVKLNVDLVNSYEYLPVGKYVIVEGESSSDIVAIEHSSVGATETGSHNSRSLKITTEALGGDMFMTVERESAAGIASNAARRSVYDAINNIGASATGELKILQQYIDNSSSASEIDAVLKTVTPQNANSTIASSFLAINNSINTIEGRLNSSNSFGSFLSGSNFSQIKSLQDYKKASFSQASCNSNAPAAYKLNSKILDLLNSCQAPASLSAKLSEVGEVWGQAFGSNAKQGNLGNDDDYNSQSLGFAFGYDKKITKNTKLGVALSYADSSADSSDSAKKTNVNIYQLNIYSSQVFNQYFLDMIGGFAWNEYNSKRKIFVVNKTANGEFSGQTYVAKIKGGFVKALGNSFYLAPELSANFHHNRTESYNESDAGTLNLEVRKNSNNFLEGRIGAAITYKKTTKTGTIIVPNLNISYGYNFLNNRQNSISNFSGQSIVMNSQSSKLDPKSLKLGGGIDIYRINSSIFSAEYMMERREKFISNYGSLKVRMEI